MKKIFTLISMAFVAMSVNAQTEESYTAVDADGNMAAEYAAIVDADGKTATNVTNGNSVIKFGTANIEVEGISTGTPADLQEGGQDLTIGTSIGENMYEYTVNSSKPIEWKKGNRGDISYWWIQGTGVPAVSAYAEEVITDGEPTGKYRLAYVAFDPEVGGLPVTGLYYKITPKVDGALKIAIWANKGTHPTYVVDGETKQVSDYLVEGYINGQTWKQEDVDAGIVTEDKIGKLKWLDNDAIKALNQQAVDDLNAKVEKGETTAEAVAPTFKKLKYTIGYGNQPFWGNLVIDAKANKTYYFFQGTTQIGFQGYTFAPGKSKEEMNIESIKNAANNANAPRYNLAGQKVSKDFKGVVLQNGKKFVQK